MAKVLFKEIQYFRQSLVWGVLLFIPPVGFSAVLAYQLITGDKIGEKPMSNISLAILSVLLYSVIAWAYRTVKLTTIIDEEKISYGWNMPTDDLNELRFSEVSEWSVIRFHFLGFGYGVNYRYGTVHILSGKYGLFLKTNKGDKVLIGTHKAEELKKVIALLPVQQSAEAVDLA